MILTCPDCGTQYVVKDDAIPPEGRQVRCAACKHSWHQDPPADAGAEPPSAAEVGTAGGGESRAEAIGDEPQESRDDGESFAEAAVIEPRTGPEAEERAYEEAIIEGEVDAPAEEQAVEPAPAAAETSSTGAEAADVVPQNVADWREPPTAEPAEDIFSPFADGESVARRRGPLGVILLLALVLALAAALFWFFAPADLKAKLGIAEAGATPLQVMVTHKDRTRLESGNDLLTVTGRVINPSAKEQQVPPIQAELKNNSGKVVYSWTIQPDTRSLAGGASTPFNSAEVNVPPGADELTITLGDARA